MAKARGIGDDEHVMQVCEASELERLTSSGWQVFEVLRESELMHSSHEEQGLAHAAELARASYSNYPERVHLGRSAVAVRHRFLLRKSASSAVAEANAASESLRQEVATLSADKKKLEQGLATVTEIGKRLEGDVERSRETASRLRDELRVSNEAKQKMERDLAAIRQDIGEAAMRRILGTPDTPTR